MRLGFDLDEVVVDLTSEMEKHIGATYGIEWPAECFINYDFRTCVFSPDEETNRNIINDMVVVANDPDFQINASPVEGAVEALHKLKRVGHKLFFITSRPKQNQPHTFKWLRDNDIPFDRLAVVGKSIPKGLFGRKYVLDMFVDDLEPHLESMLHYKKRWSKVLLLLDRPWNSNYIDGSKFQRVFNWQEILRHVGIGNR